MDEQCPLGQMSLVEESGLFNRMVASEMQGQLFCRKNSVVQELRADRCGLRHIRALKENLTARLEGANAKTVDFIQRAAADIVSFQLLLGWRKQAELTKGRYTFAALDAYLYGPLRALLFAAEINGKGPQPAICGESSELIVQAIQVTYRSCPSGGGIVSDEVLALFPKGVESSWNGAPWTAASHSCSAGK